VLALALTGCASGGALGAPAPGAKGLAAQPLVSYCDLVASPVKYLGKPVRVVGVYRVGFEWQQLYSTRCPEGYSSWVEWTGSDYCADVQQPKPGPSDSSESSQEEESPEFAGATLGMIARGTLTGGDGAGYGHMNAFTFQFDLDCLEYLEFLDSRSYHVHALTPDMRQEIERFLARTDAATGHPP
jgi:hypothetical protein